LRNVATHLHEAIAGETGPDIRRKLRADIVSTVLDADFRRAQVGALGTVTHTLGDLALALDAALDAGAFKAALACAAAYRETTRVESLTTAIFDALDEDDVATAIQRSNIFGVSPFWACALKHYLAWEAARRGERALAHEALKDTPWMAPKTLPLCDALLARTARTLAAQAGCDAVETLTSLHARGRDSPELLALYPAGSPNPPDKHSLVQALDAFVGQLEALIADGDPEWASMSVSAKTRMTESNALILRGMLVPLAAETEGRRAIDRLLPPTLQNPYARYRDIELVALGVASAAVPDPEWSAERLRTIITAGVDIEGVTFTFDLAAVLAAEGRRRHLACADLAVLESALERGCREKDRWGASARARSARAAVFFRCGEINAAEAELKAAHAELDSVFAGFASLGLLSIANRWIEFRRTSEARRLAAEAAAVASRVLDPQFRGERERLVATYRTWLDEPKPTRETIAAQLALMPDPEMRMAYVEHLSARFSASSPSDIVALKSLVSLTLSSDTTMDTVLARLFAVVSPKIDDEDLTAVIQIWCSQLTGQGPRSSPVKHWGD
jgi:hypothetical protein